MILLVITIIVITNGLTLTNVKWSKYYKEYGQSITKSCGRNS
jgi:hypothetical protein